MVQEHAKPGAAAYCDQGGLGHYRCHASHPSGQSQQQGENGKHQNEYQYKGGQVKAEKDLKEHRRAHQNGV